MLFNSPQFVAFLAIVFCLYWWLPNRRAQNALLLVASFVFYGSWSWKFLLLLLVSTTFDYYCGQWVGDAKSPENRKRLMLTSVAVNLLFLGTFKYAGFFVRETTEFLQMLGFQANVRTLEIALPIGISFYTFQSLSYVIDVYRGKLAPVRSLADYALFVAFFPHMVAGPIMRATQLLPQFQNDRVWSRSAFESGLQLTVWGLFKKMVIADNLAPYVDAVYGNTHAFSGSAITTATVFFAFQIYCDFSGYSDTARGVARMLGISLMANFEQPYFSRSPVEFWRRWHISLSQWFQDYLYFPLAMRYMRKGGWASKYKAHIISMGLIGFWHGANWTFLLFGLYWGCAIAGYVYVQERLSDAEPGTATERFAGFMQTRIADVASVALMFVMACLGWVLFRAQSMTDAAYVFTHFFSGTGLADVVRNEVVSVHVLWLMVIAFWVTEWVYRNYPQMLGLVDGGYVRRLVTRHALVAVILFSFFVAQQGRVTPFIYFQF